MRVRLPPAPPARRGADQGSIAKTRVVAGSSPAGSTHGPVAQMAEHLKKTLVATSSSLLMQHRITEAKTGSTTGPEDASSTLAHCPLHGRGRLTAGRQARTIPSFTHPRFLSRLELQAAAAEHAGRGRAGQPRAVTVNIRSYREPAALHWPRTRRRQPRWRGDRRW